MGVSFDRAIQSRRVGSGRFAYTFDETWFGLGGPHGGFLAAVILSAMQAEADAARHPRSLTVHFVDRITPGEVEIEVRAERHGRRLSSTSARVTQAGATMATAAATLGSARPGPEITRAGLPEVAPPEPVPSLPLRPQAPVFVANLEFRPVLGRPFLEPDPLGRSAAWMRLREPVPVDAAAIACLTDAWIPSILGELDIRAAAPTIDLTVHFHAEFPIAGLAAGDFVLGVFRADRASGGFWVEDGELWTRDGRLLAQSRQLALLIPMPPR